MAYNNYRNNRTTMPWEKSFRNGSWHALKLPTSPQGCIIYWFMMITGVIGALISLTTGPPNGTSKQAFIIYTFTHLLIAHLFFSYMCFINTPGSRFANTKAFAGLILWFVIWGYIIPMFNYNGNDPLAPKRNGDVALLRADLGKLDENDESSM